MIKMLLTILVIGAGLGLCAASIQLGDRSIMTSPPDAVTEGFVRELASERYERAIPYLTDERQNNINADTLKDFHTRHLKDEGVWDVSSETTSRNSLRARTRTTIRYAEGDSVTFQIPLAFSSGKWSVSDLPR